MAHLWTEADAAWSVVPLDCDVVAFDAHGRRLPATVGLPAFVLVRARDAAVDHWVLYAPSESPGRPRVNGAPLLTELRVLRDRDELAFGATTWFFSTEILPAVAPFAGTGPVTCPRCKTPVVPGATSVECPGCRTRFHQQDERPCWTYGPTCPLCGRPTALDQSYAWTPEML